MSDGDDADSAKTAIGSADDETTLVPPPTQAAPDWAWSSHDDDTEETARRSWKRVVYLVVHPHVTWLCVSAQSCFTS